MKDWFKLRANLDASSKLTLTLVGFFLTIIFWWILAELFSKQRPIYANESSDVIEMIDSVTGNVKSKIWSQAEPGLGKPTSYEKVYPLLPRPDKTLFSFKKLFTEDHLVANTLHSLWLNIQGYFWAILVSIPVGMSLSLFPFFRNMFSRQIDALRYLPLSALTGLFIIWFGLGDPMKIAFLAVGIVVYLIPVVMQRINEVEDTLIQTGDTLGATSWQKIRMIFLPASLSKLMDDIRVLTAISWTYIIIAELLNKESGIGSLIYTKARLGQTDRVFAILIVITLIGLFQDQIFVLIDKVINPHKYYNSKLQGLQDGNIGLYAWLTAIVLGIFAGWIPAAGIVLQYGGWIMAAAGTVFMITGIFKNSKDTIA